MRLIRNESELAEAHADAAATTRALQHDGIADTRCLALRVLDIVQQTRTGQQWYAVHSRKLSSGVLQPERAHLIGCRADEGDAGFDACRREVGVLRQEAVAGMNRLRSSRSRRLENAIATQIALGRRRRADAHRLVGRTYVQRRRIRFGIDGDRLHAHPAQGADHAASDGATVGDEDFCEQGAGD
jgi:hypothetical protein